MNKAREQWIDYIKVFACVLVVTGHFFQSMTQSGIISATPLTQWFDSTIYYFHVPLFFMCSGYVYQKYTRVDSFNSWKIIVFRKAVTLGVPYFVFSFVTWLLKAVFSGAVNIENAGLMETLFLFPSAPYWFLYVLFFMFVTTPTFSGKTMAWFGLAGAVVLKLISVWVGEFPIYALSKLFANEIWFVGGMVLAATNSERRLRRWPCLPIGCVLSVAFLILSVFVYDQNASLPMMPVMMGILGCTSVVMIMGCVFAAGERHPAWAFMARYTMPIFLMHTIFAAGWRTVLLKIGVISVPVHMISGLVVSFIGPMIAAEVMKRVKLLDALIAPGKYIKRDP